MSRLVVVSNRVAPITEGEPTAGGLAAGVLDALKQKGGIWFGWSGEITDDAAAAAHVERTVGSITLYTVDLSRSDYDAFYRGFANGTLWPTLHYQVGHAHFDWAEFAGYRRVNALFAQALARLVQPDDLIWAHDYHLLCLAEALREAGLRNRIGPVPAHAVSGARGVHDQSGACRADPRDVPVRSARLPDRGRSQRLRRLRCCGRRAAVRWMRGVLAAFGRTVKTGVYPIGVHVDEVRHEAEAPPNQRYASRLQSLHVRWRRRRAADHLFLRLFARLLAILRANRAMSSLVRPLVVRSKAASSTG